MPVASVSNKGAKRQRDGDGGGIVERAASHSPYSAAIEITNGTTRKAVADYLECSGLVSSISDVDVLLSSPAFRHVARSFLVPPVSAVFDGPMELGVIRLVANNDTTLLFTSDSIDPVNVPSEVGQSFCMGDVVILQRARPSCKPGDEGHESKHLLEFLTFDPSSLADAGDWCHAASWNAVTTAKWVREILSHPPGLAQVTCIVQPLVGLGADCTSSSRRVNSTGWSRSLQLPLLLRQLKRVTGVSARTVLQLKKVIFSVVRLYVAILSNAETVAPLPHILGEAIRQFVASPLFVDGLTLVLSEMAGSVSQSSWVAAQQSVLDAIWLGLRYTCGERAPTNCGGKTDCDSLQQKLHTEAERGVHAVLHRLTSIWIDSRGVDGGKADSNQPVAQLVEELARAGLFRHFVHWVRHKEQMVESSNIVGNAHCPPTMQEIRELRGLQRGTVREMMAAMASAYTPYLRQEAPRFVESSILAAYAELYGPAARAVNHFVSEPPLSEGTGDRMERWWPHISVTRVNQAAVRSSLTSYSLDEIQLHALFGMPLTATLRAAKEKKDFTRLGERGSTFGYLIVRLNGNVFVFPVIVCNVSDCSSKNCTDGEVGWTICTVDAYVLRDGDMLPSLLGASAAASVSSDTGEKFPEAWFVYEDAHGDGEKLGDAQRPQLGQEPPQFFPKGTSAISYILYIRHLQSLRRRLQHEGRKDVYAPGRLKSLQEKGSASQGRILWWGNNANDSISGNVAGTNLPASFGSSESVEDMFVTSTLLPSDGEHLRRCLDDLTEATALTPSQVECIHTLTASGRGVRTLVGAVGSGKTVIMHAASLARGRVHEELRKEHAPLWHSLIKQSGHAVSGYVAKLAMVEDMDDLFYEADTSSGRDLLEELTSEAILNINEHVQLSEKLKCCHAPLLLRPRALKHDPPKYTDRVLHEANVKDKFHSLSDALQQSYDRSMRAPLTGVLNVWLRSLRRLGNLISVVQESLDAAGEGEWKLFTEFLSWIMTQKERNDTFTEAKLRGESWMTFLGTDLWESATVVDAAAFLSADGGSGARDAPEWRSMKPLMGGTFKPVTLPNAARGLCDYGKSEAAGWLAVYGEKQTEFLNFLQKRIMNEVQYIFSFFLDLVHMVAATSQVSKVTVLTATRVSLLREILFIRMWQPRYLVIDDYDQVEDALYLALSPASVVVLSRQMDAPLQSEQQIALAVLKATQKELQGTSFFSTAVLGEALRFSAPELHKGLLLCRNSPLVNYAASRGEAPVVGSSTAEASGDHGFSGEGTHQPVQIPGFSSSSCVELWTHAVPINVGVTCDGLGAAFARARIKQVTPSYEVIVYCSSSVDRDVIIEGMSLCAEGDQADLTKVVYTLPLLPDAFVEHDEECDVAVLCLSGLARSIGHVSGLQRQKRWEQTVAEKTFVGCVERWLWKAASRARRGVLLIGSKELFRFLDPLQRIEGFAQQQRDRGEYWLPTEAKWAALALRCPEHASSRQLAILTYADYCGCKVRVIGVRECRSFCLAPYTNCTSTAHACLHACHVPSGFSQSCTCGVKGDSNLLHDRCPFPCARDQRCGHACLRSCYEPCSPCEFVGLKRLLCGQSVVTGVNDNGPTMTVVYHFQRVRCGEEPKPCEEKVTVRCPQCKTRLTMRCSDLVARGGFENFSIGELECEGCVALYNRVAKEFGLREIEAMQKRTAGEVNADLSLPVQQLPAEAQERLQKLFMIAVKKGQLMLQKEALETMQGGEASEFHRQQQIFNAQLSQQEAELRSHRDRAQENIQLWEKKLKQKYEAQLATNEEIETEVPSMLSEAIAEEERQQQYNFV
ncbi:hypothetical protein, conserved [Trypanosoma brucei brucei TREU927]|uniref:Uncharacterized protein n=1 Tax=Trypanosoma brucei brucei (strain 927/4 GUTat10.1) TaxID=185431 RepID=Q389M2_TRYB2|nr:hypothetical protein, conserved [Trypanosoma brucei brucei TREU927]EAN78498.1 hypothetical protein, conserved [Trypanosoma brucei brucei TREU927]